MLVELNIKNFAIIDDLKLEFNNGFNVLTGETGAGKSIIIDALSILSGERSNASLVRAGTNKAYIEGIFSVNDLVVDYLKELIDDLEDNLICIGRDIYSDGRSVSKINGRTYTLPIIKAVCSKIIDIHSQHDNQYLLNPNSYLELLDKFGLEALVKLKNEYKAAFNQYLNIKAKLDELLNQKLSAEEIDFIRYQIKEIKDLNLGDTEIEDLLTAETRFAQHEKIANAINPALELLSSEKGALESIYLARKYLQKVSDDSLFLKYYEGLEESYYVLEDLINNLKSDYSALNFDENTLASIKSRLYEINKIRRKHGDDYQAINQKYYEMVEKCNLFDNHEQALIDLQTKVDQTYKVCYDIATKLSILRKDLATKLEELVIKELHDLYLENAIFKVNFECSDNLTKNGIDKIDFLITTNKGQPLKTLSKVASGGEISRLMLGLKVIFNRLFAIQVIIFDEVDTGVSGKVASAVGNKMLELGKFSQVLCITHLPQVACLATFHYHVDKIIKNEMTSTIVKKLTKEEQINEIAKLISGKDVTLSALQTAKELIQQK